MSIVDRNLGSVHSNPWEDFQPPDPEPEPLPFEDDAAWFAATVLDEADHAPNPDPDTDAGWLWAEASALGAKGGPADPTGARELAGDCAADLVHLLKWAKTQSVGAYLDDPNTPYSRSGLEALKAPAPPHATAFVAELADLACYYLEEGRLAARLLACEVLAVAAEAGRFGSDDARDYQTDRAAWRAAVEDEFYAATGGDWN